MELNKLFAVEIKERIENRKFPETPNNLYAPIDYILELSGKRIRPLLVLLGADLFGVEDIKLALPASIAIEYFHNFTLIHDDIMDKAPLRRGQPTIHQKWNDNVAILSGDALLIKAYQELALCPAHLVPKLLSVFNRVALEVCEGQQLDMDFEQLDNIQQDEYIQMIRLKTSVLLGGALEMGAIIAQATVENQEKIYSFGVNLGIAFQLQDDILDAFGDPETFGKQVGGDIIVNKKTVLHILLRESLESNDKLVFEQLLELDQDDMEFKVSEMKKMYAKYKTRDLASAIKQYYTDLAYSNLDGISVSNEQKAQLYSLANQLMNRDR